MNQLDVGSVPPIRFIEFMGLPGSGKSTIAALLESDLKQCGIKTISRSTELADHAPFVWRHCNRLLRVLRNANRCRRAYLDALRLISASGQKSPLDFAKVTWNFWSVIALITDCRATSNSITIVDQGLFQAIWSIQLSSSKELAADAWIKFLRSAGVSDMLVVNVRSQISVASHRLFDRSFKRTRLGSQINGSHMESWQTATDNLAKLMCLARAILPWDPSGDRMITIESDATCPRAAAADIASAFLAHARSTDSPAFRDLCWDI
jgi:hypothetical protein